MLLLSVLPKLLLMLVQHAWWEAFEDPLVAKAFIRRHALQWIPFQTSAYQINELWVRQLSQLLHDVFDPVILLLVSDDLKRCWHSSIVRFELLKQMLAGRAAQHARIWHANNVDYQLYLLAFICTGEEREACEQLNHDASERPHVDLLCVGEDTEHDIWCPIESTLDVCVDNFILQTAAAKVSYCDPTLVLLLHQNVFGFQVAVYNA